MIIGVGVDIIKISRFTRPFGSRFFSHVFTEGEQSYIKGRMPQTMAGIFAAKESVVKAMGTGFDGFWPNSVEICHDTKGKPYVKLHGKAELEFIKIINAYRQTDIFNANNPWHDKLTNINISISHNETDAIAFAIIQSTIFANSNTEGRVYHDLRG